MKTVEQVVMSSSETIRMIVPARRAKHEEVEAGIVNMLGP